MQGIFKIGDRAVYPAQGVTEITGIETREISGNQEIFYVLRVLESNKKIMIPLSKVRSVGLRRVIDEDCVGQVVRILRTRTVKRDNQTWNRRYRAYLEKIKTGSVLDIAEVLRDLYQLKYSKTLSFGERKMLDTARSLLVREISVARGEEVDDVEEEMDDIFRDCIENSVDAQRNAA